MMTTAPWKPNDYVGSAGSLISQEMPVCGQNAHSHLFEQILTSNMYVFSEDLTRAEHCVWPTAPGGTYTELAVKIDEFESYLRKEIRLDVMRSRRSA